MPRKKPKPQPKRPKKRRPRYTLDQLLAESKAIKLFRRTKEDRDWMNGPRVGRELI
jgi:hypothetical protein